MRKYAGGFILLILSLLFVIGEQTVAGPCPVMPDGRFMVCYWAGQAVLGCLLYTSPSPRDTR